MARLTALEPIRCRKQAGVSNIDQDRNNMICAKKRTTHPIGVQEGTFSGELIGKMRIELFISGRAHVFDAVISISQLWYHCNLLANCIGPNAGRRTK